MFSKKIFSTLLLVSIISFFSLTPYSSVAQDVAVIEMANSVEEEANNSTPATNDGIIKTIKANATATVETLNKYIGAVLFATGKDVFCDSETECNSGFISAMQSSLFGDIIVSTPFLIMWLIIGAVFFTLRLGFVNLRLFTHAFPVLRGKYSKPTDPGEVTHFQALSSAVSATVGLGNIAGVAVAVAVGGPGAILWMMIAGFLGMNTKFAEVTMGLKYREINEDGTVNGGAYEYLSKGLAELNLAKLGKVLAFIFAVCCIGGSLASGNLFQSNQATQILATTFEPLAGYKWAISLTFAIFVAAILFGGIKRIASVAVKIVPVMAVVYVSSCLFIIFYNVEFLGAAISTIFNDAFAIDSATGGIIGAIINGFKRAAFSSEAGIGSAPTAHSAAKTTEPVREGVVALIEPFIDTIVVCFMSGLVIVITGVYIDNEASGVVLTSQAFGSVSTWFTYILTFAIVLFAFSTILTWGYYGAKAFAYLFGEKSQPLYKLFFCCMTFLGGIISLDIVVELSDLLLLSMAIPNLIGLYLLSGVLSKEVKSYTTRLKAGEFERTS